MFDFPHWQSAVATRRGTQALINSPSFAPWPNAALGRGYTNHGPNRNLPQPNYSLLTGNPNMQVLRGRTCASDPPSPLRICNSFYLLTNYASEFIGRSPPNGAPPNFIREDAELDPDIVREESTLDTLYLATGASTPSPLPVMTYYHGFNTPQMVFSGFPLWYFQRAQVTALVDFVMQEIFGSDPAFGGQLVRNPPAATQPARAGRVAAATQAGSVGIVQPAAGPQRR
jgi:hypothetical protein